MRNNGNEIGLHLYCLSDLVIAFCVKLAKLPNFLPCRDNKNPLTNPTGYGIIENGNYLYSIGKETET